MKLHIVFGQRKCRYEGEFAPEALDVADAMTMDENPEWLEERLTHRREDSTFEAVEVLIVNVPDEAIDALLKPKTHEVDASVIAPEKPSEALPKAQLDLQRRRWTRCQSDDDGDCQWVNCPQLRDGEPERSGRHCPLDADEDNQL